MSNYPKKTIFIFVLTLHILALIFLVKEDKRSLQKNASLLVKTLMLPKKAPTVKAPALKKIGPKKRIALRKPSPNKPKKKTKPALAKQKKMQETLDKLQHSLAKIQLSDEETSISLPQAISFEHSVTSAKEKDFQEKLIALFSKHLKLPDHGKVKVFLKLSPEGKILLCDFLFAESKENQAYLKNQLHNLNFPCFNGECKSIVVCFSDV